MCVKHGVSRSLQGLSGVENVCVGRDIPELRALFCGFVNSNEILYNEETPPPPPPPPQSMGFFYVPFHFFESTGDLCVPCHLLLFIFLFIWPLDLFQIV